MKTKMMTATAALLMVMSAAAAASPAESARAHTAVNFEDRCCGYRGGEGRGWHSEDHGGHHGHSRGYCYDDGSDHR